MLDHERHVVGTHLERRARSVKRPRRVVPEPRIEEPRVVGAELAAGRVVRCHLGGEPRRNPDRLLRQQQIEPPRGQDDAVAVLARDRVPVVLPPVPVRARHLQHGRVLAGPVAHPPRLVASQIESQEQPVRRGDVGPWNWFIRPVQDGLVLVQRADLLVCQPGASQRQPQLVERQPLLHANGERQRHDLEVQAPPIPRPDLVEPEALIADDPREHVQPAGRALRVGLPAHVSGELQLLDEWDQVGPVGLQDRAVAPQVQLVDDELLEPHLDGAAVGQEAAADAVGHLAQAKVDAGRLDARGRDLEVARVDDPKLDRLLQ